MSFLDDPDMRELVDEFCKESLDLLDQLEEVLEELEDSFNSSSLEHFGQLIDRIMGAAKSIGADDIGKYCELGKIIGYKSSQSKDLKLLQVVLAVLFDTTDLVKKMILKIQNNDATYMENLNTEAFGTRLKWLSEKFKHIERASCAVDERDNQDLDQTDIDSLLSDLGL